MSFHTAFVFSCLFWGSLESEKEEGGAGYADKDNILKTSMWESLKSAFTCSFALAVLFMQFLYAA